MQNQAFFDRYDTVSRSRKTRRPEEEDVQRSARQLLATVGLLDRGNALAKNLPYGDQRKLEIARALALEPKLLLLDEPTAGMNPTESEDLMQLLRRIHAKGVSLLLIEHQMRVEMNLCHRVAVLDYGAKIADAAPADAVPILRRILTG